MLTDVQRHVASCPTCQLMKSSQKRPAGQLQPIPPPGRAWQQVTMDFVTGLLAGASACESAPLGTAPAQALHTFTLDSGASRCFFRDSTTVTPLPAPVPVSLADPSGGPVLARSSTVLPCPAVPSYELSGLHLPSFSTNLVSNAVLQDAGVDTFTPGRQRVAICTCSQTGRHLATFTHAPGSSLYTLTTASRSAPLSPRLHASAQVAT
ncbi:unnamed protein product [Closterium sp. NIES-54]